MRWNTCELREKDVINLCDGARLGCPSDFEFDACDGKITAIVIPRPSGFLGMSHERDLIVPWRCIECIGEDAILVRLSPGEIGCVQPKNKKKRYGNC